MATIFPREEKAEQLFEKILENPDACERLKDTFYEHFPESEDMDAQMHRSLRGRCFRHTRTKICRHF